MQTSDWIAGGSAVVSVLSAAFTWFYARTQHKLNKMHVAEKERKFAERKVVVLRAELMMRSASAWFVRTTNISKGTAFAVTVSCQSNEGVGSLLTDEDIGHITPVATLTPGDHFDIKATNWYGMAGPQSVFYNWNDEDGKFCTTTIKVLVD